MLRKLLIAALVLMAWTVGTANAQTMDRILAAKKVKVGFIPSPPSTIKDPKTG
ncbi:MAG: cyclohexadienyl dehydratase, partial [Alphaproteobacteria bacterium]|nr:cyclohexadienyl dehydratase [Alphaproteobacteria bacterium]